MTPEQREALREHLYGKSVRELVEAILDCYDELEEAKQIRRRMMQIRNLVLEPGERRKPGRPSKKENPV